MKRYHLFFIILLSCIALAQQTKFNQFLSQAMATSNMQTRQALVDTFWNFAKTKGIPYCEGTQVAAIYRSATASGVYLAGDFNGWSPTNAPLNKLAGTDLFYVTADCPINARIDYKYVVDGNWILDPNNSKICMGGYGPNSELAMPGYIQPWEINYKGNISHGTIETKSIKSKYTGKTYQINVYLPPNYKLSKTMPTAYFQDGGEYINLGYANNIIDNLLDSNKIEPFIGIFVTPTDRNEEYVYSLKTQYRLFFVNELVPYIDSIYNTYRTPEKRLVIGDSFGGNISAQISFNHPDIFGMSGWHSPAFWPNNNETAEYVKNSNNKSVKVYSVWGSLEGTSMGPIIQSVVDTLQYRGNSVKYAVYPEGHSWGLWRATLDDMLKFFFPANLIKNEHIYSSNTTKYVLENNYPNPFNPSTTIKYSIPSNSNGLVTLKIYNIIGKEIATLVNQYQASGNYSIKFNASNIPSGLYFYKLSAPGFTQTKKMQLIK